MSTVVKTTSSFAVSAVSELRKKWAELVSGETQSWLGVVLEWIKETRAGKLAVGLMAVMVARPIADRIQRYFRGYPPGTVGWIPMFSNLWRIHPKSDTCLLNDLKYYGPISLHWMGLTGFVLINTVSAARVIYTNEVINRDGITSIEQRNRLDQHFVGITGRSHFAAVNEESNWSERRKKFVRAQSALLKSDTLTSMIAQYFENKVVPSIKSGQMWDNQRENLTRIAFNTMFHFGFGSKIERSEEEMTEFISNVLDGFATLPFLFVGRSFPIPWIGARLTAFLSGNKMGGMMKSKKQTEEWFERFKELPDRSDAQYAEWLQNWVDEGGIDFDHANADLGSLFFAGTHTTTTNLEQILMHCARNPGLTAKMRDDLKKEFNDPSEFTLDRIRNQTPLVYAFVLESLRLSTSVRFNLPRVLTEDLRVEEYGLTLPKGSMLSLNLFAIHRSEQVWGKDALGFHPLRWMDETGHIDRQKKNTLMTFGVGPRDCPGADLARKQLILILAHFVIRYRIEPSDGYTAASLPFFNKDDYLGPSSPFPLRFTFLVI